MILLLSIKKKMVSCQKFNTWFFKAMRSAYLWLRTFCTNYFSSEEVLVGQMHPKEFKGDETGKTICYFWFKNRLGWLCICTLKGMNPKNRILLWPSLGVYQPPSTLSLCESIGYLLCYWFDNYNHFLLHPSRPPLF